ncbi:binding-protein-dependent transport systems inner membrane component [Exiguobacterium sibiricum 255-15]|uniref:Binding-protein-dependent transport systems inner membrane component n=1 Tax=Exiguobacterium sibiricum (strain DSM 17290 / CCUG 55495 / CIP 109462 / JCM 13490 / 255-15) TaxID=262543 RepID=B1YFE1_EXIS2|nr:ABC transporter permease [Exiguobacterium sibiricum]ACB60817.1 binding-protein-dependent transport systems inner membrane component [Exiguobacterium sibiricum 255-15]
MGVYILKRVGSVIPILLLAILLLTVMIHLSPVDPAEAYLSAAHIQPTEEVLAQKRAEFGLDQSFLTQYVTTVVRLASFDFGTSYVSGKPVLDEVLLRLPATVQLALSSLLLAIFVSIPLGFLAGIRKNGFFDQLSRGIAFIGASIPSFWLGYLLIFFFSVQLDLLPVGGIGSPSHVILPAITLALPLIALYTRLLRTSVIETMREPYVLFARTRGIRETIILGKHVLRVAIPPMLTGLGMNLGKLLTGTIIVETVFSWPGFGRYFIEAIFDRDMPIIQGYVFLAALLFIGSSLFVDLLQLAIDPRIARKGGNRR